ncbi:hypothetical protein [Streptomyces sp. NPDC016845]|uniref:hypothetical protein n=1 Tax=Streptomyces sp. NPDC016845 TaxID=3364972 RepID=UPI00379E6E1F
MRAHVCPKPRLLGAALALFLTAAPVSAAHAAPADTAAPRTVPALTRVPLADGYATLTNADGACLETRSGKLTLNVPLLTRA